MAMPVDKRKVTIKTLLMAVAIPLIVFGVQMVLDGQVTQGGVVLVLGVVSVGVFVVFQEYDVPYEDEIRDIVRTSDITTEDVKGLAEAISSQVDEQINRADSTEGDGDDR